MMNNDYSVADLAAASRANQAKQTVLEDAKPADVGDFQKAMSNTGGAIDKASSPDDTEAAGDNKLGGDKMKQLLMMLLELITMLMKSMEGGDKSDDDKVKSGESKGGGGTAPAPSGDAGGSEKAGKGGSESAKVENGKVVAENNVGAGDEQIPKPTEHMQSFDLGGKQVTIGGDGTASATEVQETKDTLMNLYENSTTFKNMIDSSSNDNFEVSVGKRDDNMSWGNADGRIFMNVNNVTPGANDSFEALTAHEMAHAGAGMRHGAEMEKFEQTVAAEA
ncbi:MAG: hypothetical protein KAG20_07045 [Cocleimonas sp.]|nr:hypothetical protein [Cocleimonas sp.]